jgi:hypothetical protein
MGDLAVLSKIIARIREPDAAPRLDADRPDSLGSEGTMEEPADARWIALAQAGG